MDTTSYIRSIVAIKAAQLSCERAQLIIDAISAPVNAAVCEIAIEELSLEELLVLRQKLGKATLAGLRQVAAELAYCSH